MMRITINDWHFLHVDLLAIIGSLSLNYDQQVEQRKICGFQYLKCLFHLYVLCYLYIQYVVVLMQTCFNCSLGEQLYADVFAICHVGSFYLLFVNYRLIGLR